MPRLKPFPVLAIVGVALPCLAMLLCASSAVAQNNDGNFLFVPAASTKRKLPSLFCATADEAQRSIAKHGSATPTIARTGKGFSLGIKLPLYIRLIRNRCYKHSFVAARGALDRIR